MAANSETVETGTTYRASSGVLGFPNYFASGTGEENFAPPPHFKIEQNTTKFTLKKEQSHLVFL